MKKNIIKRLKRNLPSGTVKHVAQKTGLSTCTVSCVLNGKVKSPKEAKILNATAEYLAELKSKEAEAMDNLNAALGK